jgi:hypothetical protein
MKRIVALSLVFLSLSACLFKNSSDSGSGGLSSFATRADTLTYEAIYNFGISGQLAGGVSTRLEIAQVPPATLRRLDTTTRPAKGSPISISSWFVTNANGHFACALYGGATRCTPDPVAGRGFGDAQIDGFFDLPRKEDSFDSVRKSTRPFRLKGEKGTCFEAVPVTPSAAPISSPQPTLPAERFHYELCYSDDGILLRARRTNLAEVEAGGQSQDYLLEAVSITRVVQPSDVRLPGPIVKPEDLKP